MLIYSLTVSRQHNRSASCFRLPASSQVTKSPVVHPLSIQQFTQCFFSNSFVLKTIHLSWGVRVWVATALPWGILVSFMVHLFSRGKLQALCTGLRSGQIGALRQELFLPWAKGISKESGGPPLEPPPKGWSPVEDGTAAVIAKDLFHARDSGGIFLVFDAVNPLIATITIKRRFYLRGQHFHFEFNLRSSRPSEFGSPSLWPKRNI